MLLINGLSTFPNKRNQFLSKGSKSLSKNPPDCPIFCIYVFDNFVLAEELFAKALRNFESCILVNNSL